MTTTTTTPLVAYQFGTFHSHPSMYMYNPAREIILRSPTNKAWKVQTPIPVDCLICIKTPINSERVIILELEHSQRSLLGCGSFLFMRFTSVWFSKGGLFFSDTFSVRPGYFSSFGEKPETLCCRSVRLFGYKITSYVQYSTYKLAVMAIFAWTTKHHQVSFFATTSSSAIIPQHTGPGLWSDL